MSSLTTYCATCGNALDLLSGQACPYCAARAAAAAPVTKKDWGIVTGMLVWLASCVLIIGFQAIALVAYFAMNPDRLNNMSKAFEADRLLIVLSIATTFPAHLLTLLVCWFVVTEGRRRPFLQTLGWSWDPQFRWVHAVALAFLMYAVAFLFESLLPSRETGLEKILRMGTSVRVLVASLAVLTAPLVEEVVYRGVLYTGIERTSGKVSGVILVTALFALVHVPQYWGSYAAIMSIIALSLVLTLLRATTGKLLPCVATHLVYNGIQSILVLWNPGKVLDNETTKTALTIIWRCLGFN